MEPGIRQQDAGAVQRAARHQLTRICDDQPYLISKPLARQIWMLRLIAGPDDPLTSCLDFTMFLRAPAICFRVALDGRRGFG